MINKCAIIIFFLAFVPGHSFSQDFTDIAPAQGIEHSFNTDLSIGGGGVCFFDFDNDGWDDITFIQESDSILFYKNNNGSFDKIESFIFNAGKTKQLLWVDYDNDSDNDAILVTYEGPLRLFKNEGGFNFTEVTEEAGLLGLNTKNHGVSFADYNKSGYLDFYLTRYTLSGNSEDSLQTNALFKNNGDGTFTNVTEFAGVGDSIQPSFMGGWLDINDDLYPDLYVVNDRVLWGNSLYLNNGDGTFTDITQSSGAEMFGEDPMSVSFDDFDNDEDIDILCANGGVPTKPIRLYINQNNGTFVEGAGPLNINVPDTFHCTWGANWIDYDNDTYKDLYITTGLLTLDSTNEIRSFLFKNDQGGNFIDSPQLFNSDHLAASYSVAKGDINNDGFSDLVVQNAKNFNSLIWENSGASVSSNGFIKVTLEGTISNRMAIGSLIKVYLNNIVQTYYTRCGENFISQDSQHHIFGLKGFNSVDSIVVKYPSGIEDRYYDLNEGQDYTFVEGETEKISIDYNGSTMLCIGDSIVLDGGDYNNHVWSDGSGSRYLTVHESGTYTVLAENSFGLLVESDTVEIQIIDPPIIDESTVNISCFGDNNGIIELEVSTNASSFDINWNNGMTGDSIYGLSQGSYNYEYIDNAGCTSNDSIEIFEPTKIQVFSSYYWNSQSQTYTLEFAVIGGLPPYSISYSGNNYTDSITGLASGEHVITVVDQAGCSEDHVVLISEAGIHSNELNTITCYPNPNSSGVINFTGLPKQCEIELYNPLGKRAAFEFLKPNKISLSNNDIKGVYLLRITSSEQTTLKKIIIQ